VGFYRVAYTALAEQDVLEIVNYLEEEVSIDVAKRFLQRLDEAEHSLERMWAHEVKYDDVRTLAVRRFPYLMHYSVDTQTKTLLIETVLHMKRDSKLGSQ
jgi:plasmid stabilization system protein ParE